MGVPTSDPEIQNYGREVWCGNTKFKTKPLLGNIFVSYNILLL